MKKYILLAAVAISLGGCNSEDAYMDDPIAAQISATIGDNDPTRASDITWDKDDNIGITMSGRYSNIEYVTANGDGKFEGTAMYFRNKQEAVTITAYYPYTGTEGKTPAIIETSTGVDRQTKAEQPKFDFLYAMNENVTGADPKVKLVFQHRMSKLTLTFKNGNDGTDVSKINSCRIDGLIMEGTFNPVNGDCSAKTTGTATFTLTPTVKHGEALLSLILFPQIVDKVTMHITDSENQEYSCQLKFDGNRLESGFDYSYTIKVMKTGLSIEDYSISKWTEKKEESEATSE